MHLLWGCAARLAMIALIAWIGWGAIRSLRPLADAINARQSESKTILQGGSPRLSGM